MSQENVERFRRAFDGFNQRDIEPMLEISDPAGEWYPLTAEVEGNDPYIGREGLRQWWENVGAAFEELEASLEEVRDLGDTVLALGHLRAQFKSGVALNTETAWLIRFREGLVVWGHAYLSHAEALEAASLSE